MRKTKSRQLWIACYTIIVVVCAIGTTHSTETRTVDKLAILQPIHGEQDREAVGQRERSAVTPDGNARRIVPELAQEVAKKKWPVVIEDYEKVIAAENAVRGNEKSKQKPPRFHQYAEIAKKLGVRYVASYVVNELIVYKTKGLPSRVTGRCRIELVVYDATENQFVWQTSVEDKSQRFGGFNLQERPRLDQTLQNALRKALEPFASKGERMKVQRPSHNVAVTVKHVTDDGKTALLEVGSDADVGVGDEFCSLDGKCRMKVTEVLQNGLVAQLVEGSVKPGDILKCSE